MATVSKLSIIQPPSTMDCTHHTPGVVAHENSNWRGRACLQRSYHLPVMRSAAQARNERHRGTRVRTRA